MATLRQLLNRHLSWDALTAEFREPDSPESDAHFNKLIRPLTPMLAAVGSFMTLVFWPIDFLITQREASVVEAFFWFRLVSLAVCAWLIVSVRYIDLFRRRPMLTVMPTFVVFSMASGWLLGGAHDLTSPVFWVWMMFCFLLLALPMRLGTRILAHTGTLGGYAAAYMSRQHDIFAQENFAIASMMVLSTLFLSVVMGNLITALTRRSFRQARELEAARAESDRLLSAILPGSVAERLKRDRGVIADRFDESTVLFADLVGFTALANVQEAEETVATLNDIFSAFDALTEEHGLEKIKTIGDAYMVVGGVPVPREGHAQAVCHLAQAMIVCIAELASSKRLPLQLRIGVHSGPVVAGVIGTQKPSYDVWGDTVNIASRMESHGVQGRVHITGTVVAGLDGAFELEERGTIKVKGKGPMRTWFLRSPSSG